MDLKAFRTVPEFTTFTGALVCADIYRMCIRVHVTWTKKRIYRGTYLPERDCECGYCVLIFRSKIKKR